MLGFESLFPCQNEAPQKRCFFRSGRGIEDSHHSAELCEARGSHTPLVDRQARLSGGECGYLHEVNTPIPDHQPMVFFSFIWLWNRLPNPSAEPLARHGVRISHPKVGVLAHQTQAVEIFATGEYPKTERPPHGGLFFFPHSHSGNTPADDNVKYS